MCQAAIAGLVVGCALALWLRRWRTALLFEIPPTDPATFAVVAAALALVAALASYLPARRPPGGPGDRARGACPSNGQTRS
jgi:hypothetical protein